MLSFCKDENLIPSDVKSNYITPAYCANEILDSVLNDINDYATMEKDIKDFHLNIKEFDIK